MKSLLNMKYYKFPRVNRILRYWKLIKYIKGKRFLNDYICVANIVNICDINIFFIDTESELLIQNTIEKLTKGSTSIVIAHRLSSIRNADKIIILEKGEIIEKGSHNELILLENGAYRKLYEYQLEGKE